VLLRDLRRSMATKKKKALSPRNSKLLSLAGTFGQSTASGAEVGPTFLVATAALRQKERQ
jgi:hypothetical protein